MLLELEHVGRTHWVGPYEKPTLVDVSVSLDPGDFVGVWGEHRSGKSTLLRIAAGLEAPDAGTVRFDGTDLATLSDKARGDLRLNEIGLVAGEPPNREEITVGDYLALPLFNRVTRAEAHARARNMLRRVGIAECRDAKWRHLSDWERGLVSLAHGLVREPRLLLVDDVTGRLDPLQADEVLTLLRTAAGDGLAVLMTSSAMSALPGTHETFTLNDGGLTSLHDAALGADVLEFPSGGQLG